MLTLSKLADVIFENATSFTIEEEDQWDGKVLTKTWFLNNQVLKDKYTSQAPGWYWIGADINFDRLKFIKPFDNCAKDSGCNIQDVVNANLRTFGNNLICKENEDGFIILYNGHQGKVIQRLRQHFVLNNNNTGALGLNAYPLSSHKWRIWYFSEKHLSQLPENVRTIVSQLINNSIGRGAVEAAWRAENGWPILCKA